MESEPHRQHLHGFACVWQMRSFFDIDDWALRAKVTLGLSGRSAMSMVLAMERSDSASEQVSDMPAGLSAPAGRGRSFFL